MNIEYVGRHVTLDDRIRAHAEQKLGRILKFLAEPVEVHVSLDAEKHRQIAEIRLSHRHGSVRAREENADVLEAIDLAVEHLERQARRSRKKSVDRRRRANRFAAEDRHWPFDVLERESVGKGAAPRIVKSSRLEIKPMSLDDAALQLETSRNGFVVFLDAESEKVSVLYKRRDDNYGLIVPEV
ncbi:MAG: raiA [Acidobacteria bacterium]|jgi:putative sigma-54 modulation protein|nr:raiA [Acidobacteriota bacterium]